MCHVNKTIFNSTVAIPQLKESQESVKTKPQIYPEGMQQDTMDFIQDQVLLKYAWKI